MTVYPGTIQAFGGACALVLAPRQKKPATLGASFDALRIQPTERLAQPVQHNIRSKANDGLLMIPNNLNPACRRWQRERDYMDITEPQARRSNRR